MDMHFGSHVACQKTLVVGTFAVPFLLDGVDYDKFCHLHLMPCEIPTGSSTRERQVPKLGMQFLDESTSQATIGTSQAGASSSFSGIDTSFWAPKYVDYIGIGCEMVHYEVPTAFPSDYRLIPEGVTQVFLSSCL